MTLNISDLRKPHVAFYPPRSRDYTIWRSLAEKGPYGGVEYMGEVYDNIWMKTGMAVPGYIPIEEIAVQHGVSPDPVYHYFYKAELGDKTTHWCHADAALSDLALVSYLSPANNKGIEGGTALLTHRRTGIYDVHKHRKDAFAILQIEASEEKAEDFDMSAIFFETPGWTVTYPTSYLHARLPRYGYGIGIENARIVYVAFLKCVPGASAPAPNEQTVPGGKEL